MDLRDCKRTKLACYATNVAMSSVFGLPPLLFATFREMYGISYTLLGTLVLINFCTQLAVDLIFTFFTKYFNIHKAIRFMPLLTSLGLVLYALIPAFWSNFAYAGLVAGTFLFSIAAGLGEVLISPVIAALPSDTPDKDMSTLHSLYGYGLVGVILVSTLFLQFVGSDYWVYLTLFWAILPVIASVMLFRCNLPDMNIQQTSSKDKSVFKKQILVFCTICIFLGAAAEVTMTNWISVYAENVLHIPKIWGDTFGMCLFAALLALTRSAYAKFGKNIFRVLTLSMIGAALCYLTISFTSVIALSFGACILLGVCTSMLWPGTLILMEEKIPAVGVAAYALMAAGGDMGASVAPQMLGAVVDSVSASEWVFAIAERLSMSCEEIGFKVGMFLAALFPIAGCILLICMKRFLNKKKLVDSRNLYENNSN